jgi:hypothetical protein
VDSGRKVVRRDAKANPFGKNTEGARAVRGGVTIPAAFDRQQRDIRNPDDQIDFKAVDGIIENTMHDKGVRVFVQNAYQFIAREFQQFNTSPNL